MINLLPPEEKKKVSDERRKRVVLVLLFFLVLFLILSSGVIYGVQRYGINILESEREIFSKAKSNLAMVEEKGREIEEFNRILNYIKEVNNETIGVDDLFIRVEEKIPSGVEIHKLSLERSTEGYQATLSGNAAEWEQLISLEENLNQFAEVNFSSDSWRQVEDIDFLVKFTILDEQEE